MKNSIKIFLVPCVFFVLFSCGGGDGSDTPSDICEDGYELIDGACNLTGTLVDTDADTISDSLDNCPLNWNPSQSTSGDTDSIADACDNCMYNDNEDQADQDSDGIGDICEDDTDGDGIVDSIDNCDTVINADQANADGDSCGDSCDDNDGNADICSDADGDLIEDSSDNCPNAANTDQCDTDHDEKGNACEDDTDGDGNPDSTDTTYPLNPSETCIADTDSDGICDDFDNCPTTPNPCQSQTDTDADGLPDECDTLIDADGDGYASNDPDAAKKDCNDSLANVHPGATEECDGVDTDCDGYLDNGFSDKTYYQDADHDGYGNQAGPTKTACEKPTTCSTTAITPTDPANMKQLILMIPCVEDHTDCNDRNASIHPDNGDPDNTDDGLDNDCDGSVDEAYVEEDEPASYPAPNTAGLFFQGFSFTSNDDHRQILGLGAYLGNVAVPCSENNAYNDYNDEQLCFMPGKNITLESDTTHDFDLYYQTLRINSSSMGFYNGEFHNTTEDGGDLPGTEINISEIGTGDYDHYAIIIRGFMIAHDNPIEFQKIKVVANFMYTINNEMGVPLPYYEAILDRPSSNKLIPTVAVEAFENSDGKEFEYWLKYTIVGFNDEYISYAEYVPDDWQIKSADGNTKDKELDLTLNDSTTPQFIIPAMSGFVMESYDKDYDGEEQVGYVSREAIRLGFHLTTNGASSYNHANIKIYANGNCEGNNSGAAFKVNTIVFGVLPNNTAYKTDQTHLGAKSTASGTKSYTEHCQEADATWTCEREAN